MQCSAITSSMKGLPKTNNPVCKTAWRVYQRPIILYVRQHEFLSHLGHGPHLIRLIAEVAKAFGKGKISKLASKTLLKGVRPSKALLYWDLLRGDVILSRASKHCSTESVLRASQHLSIGNLSTSLVMLFLSHLPQRVLVNSGPSQSYHFLSDVPQRIRYNHTYLHKSICV